MTPGHAQIFTSLLEICEIFQPQNKCVIRYKIGDHNILYTAFVTQMVESDAVMVSEMLQQSQAAEESGGRKRGGRRADKKAGGKRGAQEASSKSAGRAELQFMSIEEVRIECTCMWLM